MGTSKRYAHHFDHLNERRVKMRGEPQSLTDAELERDIQPPGRLLPCPPVRG